MALTVKQVEHAKPGDRLGDGSGLWLFVAASGTRSWMFRFTSPVTRKAREMGLGPANALKLAEARDSAQQARKLVLAGKDPIEERSAQRVAVRVETAKSVTFKEYAEKYISGLESGWKNPKHRQQWRNSLRDHVSPVIGGIPVPDVDTEAVLKVLRPIWTTIPETARRVRGRIEAILDAAKVEGLRTGENPALWRGHLDKAGLAKRRKSDVKHHAALPYSEMPAFWEKLVADSSDAARMLRWIILTACRFNEAHDVDIASEIKGNVWTIPAGRMKAEEKHEVPLTPLALKQIPFRPVSDVSLTKCIARHTDSRATTHGMRSTFRDWAGDETSTSREVIEMALAHTLGDDTEAAYRRGRALTKRRTLMDQWAAYCSGK